MEGKIPLKVDKVRKKSLLERSLNDMFWKKVMILFDAKKEKKVEKEDRTQAGQTSRSATEVQSLPPKIRRFFPPPPPSQESRC